MAKRLPAEKRRALILEAALEVFAEKGFSGARTKDIAARAGVSDALVFRHFHTKAGLYRAALGLLFQDHPVMPEVREKMAERDDAGVLSALALHLIHHNRRDPRILRLALFSALEGFQFGEMSGGGGSSEPTLSDMLARYFEERVRDGAFEGVRPDLAAMLFIETLFMFLADRHASVTGDFHQRFTDVEVVDALTAIFLRGLSA